MIPLARQIVLCTFLCAFMVVKQATSQNVLNPADPLVNYDSTNRPTPPGWMQIGKWVRTPNQAVRERNTAWYDAGGINRFKAYIFQNISFRLMYPKSYNPTANDGKKYPLIILLHGKGENAKAPLYDAATGLNYDNEFHLIQGPREFDIANQNGTYDGYVLVPQITDAFYSGITDNIMHIVKYMIANNKVDPFRIVANGLSEGGLASWDLVYRFPTYISSSIPMSSPLGSVNAALTNDPTYLARIKFTPIWLSNGGLDNNPSPPEVQQVKNMMTAAGANFRVLTDPGAAHSTWYQMWGQPDFWPFVNRSYSSNPWLLGGPKTFAPGQTINETIGIAPGFQAYEWRKDGGAPIAGATSNTLNVTSTGIYEARVMRDNTWSDWSRVPLNIRTGFYEAEQYTAMSGVATEATTDAGGGLNVGYIETGDWMDYSVNVSAAGSYAINLRVATGNAGQVQVRNSAGAVLATVNIPPTGGWQSWQTVSGSLSLPAGVQTLRLYATTGGWNINWFQIGGAGATPPPPPPPPPATSTRIEAEDYIAMNGVQKEVTSDAGGGQNVGYIDNGDWMDYNITAAAAGTQALSLRVASPYGGSLQIKNGGGTVLATVTIPNTGGWQFWQTVTANINLNAGTQTIRVQSTSNGWNFNWMEPASATPPPPASTTSRIEAEDYTSMNGVVKESTTDAGGGLNIGYVDLGDWMDYGVNVSAAGTYGISLRVASTAGGQLQLRSSTGSILATVPVPNTGGWQSWQTVSANITLAAGAQTIRVYASSGGWNLNWMELGTGTTTAPVTSRVEAENYLSMSGVVKETTTDAGGGQNLGYIDNGDWMDYAININSAGNYGIRLRVASPSGGQLQIRNSSGAVLTTILIPATGGWQTWQSVSGTIALPAGSQTIRVYSASNGWNFNWFELLSPGTATAAASQRAVVAAEQPATAATVSIYPNPVIGDAQLQVSNELTGQVRVQVYSLSGALQQQFSFSKPARGTTRFNLPLGSLSRGSYVMRVSMNGWTESKQMIKQ